jgi:hypothetical protein
MIFLAKSLGYNFLSVNPYNNFPSVTTPSTLKNKLKILNFLKFFIKKLHYHFRLKLMIFILMIKVRQLLI